MLNYNRFIELYKQKLRRIRFWILTHTIRPDLILWVRLANALIILILGIELMDTVKEYIYKLDSSHLTEVSLSEVFK